MILSFNGTVESLTSTLFYWGASKISYTVPFTRVSTDKWTYSAISGLVRAR